MTQVVEIPRITDVDKRPNSPGWIIVERFLSAGGSRPMKPVIRCNCGQIMGIGDHHVHADGRVTDSFYDRDGCGWHVHLRLLDYHFGEFPPDKKPMRKASQGDLMEAPQ